MTNTEAFNIISEIVAEVSIPMKHHNKVIEAHEKLRLLALSSDTKVTAKLPENSVLETK